MAQFPSGYTFSRTAQNFVIWSEQYITPYWDVTSYPMTIVPNATTAPDGTNTAYSVTGTTTGVGGLFAQTVSASTGIGSGIQTSSIYAKANTTTQFTLNCYYGGDTEVNVTFTLTGAGSATAGGTIVSIGNGWYRCSIQTPAMITANASFAYRVWPQLRGNLAAVGCYFWGAAVNNGSTLLPYIGTLDKQLNQNFGSVPVDMADMFVRKELFLNAGLWTCGYNNNGGLGNGTTVNYSSPIQVGSLTNWKQVAGGFGHTASIKTDGTLWTCGSNQYGQLGNGTTSNYSSPIQIGSLTNWKQVSAVYYHTASIKTDGTLWTWGWSLYGQLGNGTIVYYSSPIQVGTLTNWKQVAGGGYHTTSIKTDGTLWTCGYNGSGQLGNGTIVYYSSPIQVGSLTNWKQVAGGLVHTAAIKTDGTLWTCGSNQYGQLGNGTTLNYSSPIQVGTLTNWKQVAGGLYHTASISSPDLPA